MCAQVSTQKLKENNLNNTNFQMERRILILVTQLNYLNKYPSLSCRKDLANELIISWQSGLFDSLFFSQSNQADSQKPCSNIIHLKSCRLSLASDLATATISMIFNKQFIYNCPFVVSMCSRT